MSATWTYKAGEAKRKDFMVFWVKDNTSTINAAALDIIGKGVEDMPISANPTSEEKQDVLGNNNYNITGYAKSMTVDPLKVEGDSAYSQKIDELEEKQAVLDDLKLTYLCVKKYKTNTTGECRAWTQEGIVELGDFAGALAGVSAAHTVHYVGERTYGSFNIESSTFTPDASASE